MWVLDFVGINWSKLWRSLSADQQTHWTGKRPLLYNKLSHEHCICLKPKQAPRVHQCKNTKYTTTKSKKRTSCVCRWEKWTNECWWKGKAVDSKLHRIRFLFYILDLCHYVSRPEFVHATLFTLCIHFFDSLLSNRFNSLCFLKMWKL